MGMLYDEASGQRIVLRAEHVFGRNPVRSDTYLADQEISMMHAVVRWREGGWSIADYGRNGTFQDERAVPKGLWNPLELGQTLRFGANSFSRLQVVDVSPPVTSLVPSDPRLSPTALKHNNLLPNTESPELSIYQTEAGDWVSESDGEARTLVDGDTVSVAGRAYRLVVSEEIDDTAGPALCLASRDLKLCFSVTSDEEHASLQVLHWPHSVDLGERSHHYCLVTLARRRVADAEAGLAMHAQGWLRNAELSRLLKIDLQHLNVQIFRARHQLMSALPSAARLADIVERRRGALRFGELAFDILRDARLEACYRPQQLAPRMTHEA
jgi:hypothetical protein